MSGKPRSVVSLANPRVLADAAEALTQISPAIERRANQLYARVSGLHWRGASYDAAVGRAGDEKTQMTRVADAIDQMATVMRSGSQRMAPMVDNLNTSAANLESDEFKVDNHWKVTDDRDYTAAEKRNAGDPEALSMIADARRRRGQEAANETVRLQRLAQELHDADLDTKRAIGEAEELVRSLAPVTAGLSKRQAELDLTALKNGTLTPGARERLKIATSLSPEQSAALHRGEVVEIPGSQFNYLTKMMGELDNATGKELLKVHNAAPGLLGNAFRMISTPNVQTKGGAKGGLDRLPDTVVSLLRENPLQRDLRVTAAVPQTFIGVKRLDDFRALNTILNDHADRSLQFGTDIDRGMLKQASEIAGALPDDNKDYFGFYDERQPVEDVRKMVSSMLENSGRDHQAVTDFLTGERMDVTVAEGHKYDADRHVLNILSERWTEDGVKLGEAGDLRGGRALFEWIGEAAPAEGYEGELGGKAAGAIARILIEHENELDGLLVERDHVGVNKYETFGDRNAVLSQVLAKTLAPYFGNFAGAPSEVLVNQSAGNLEDTVEFSKLIGVLSTDPGAARIALTASVQWENFLAHEYGNDPDNTALATAAAKMHTSTDEGLTNALTTLADNDEWERLREWNERSFLIEATGGLIGGAGLKVPGLSEVAGLAVPLVKMDQVELPGVDPQNQEEVWRTELKDLGTSLDKLTTGHDRVVQVTSGYIEDRPDLWGKPWRDESGNSVQFVKPDGTLDMDVVNRNKQEFSDFAAAIGAEDVRFEYNDHYRESLEDPTIDDAHDSDSEVSDSAPR